MTATAITIEFDPDALHSYTDEHLAMLWHLAQANPADGMATSKPGELAERIGREIIRRWLATVPPELHRHQGRHYYWHELTRIARYQPEARPVLRSGSKAIGRRSRPLMTLSR
jgi:hypothetical protein